MHALLLLQWVVTLLGPFPSNATIRVGETRTYCVYYRFANNKVAMRSRDESRCGKDFRRRYSSTRRSISAARQAWIDTRCIVYTSSNPAVAKVVSQETCQL